MLLYKWRSQCFFLFTSTMQWHFTVMNQKQKEKQYTNLVVNTTYETHHFMTKTHMEYS